jgi:hypothetical protein
VYGITQTDFGYRAASPQGIPGKRQIAEPGPSGCHCSHVAERMIPSVINKGLSGKKLQAAPKKVKNY